MKYSEILKKNSTLVETKIFCHSLNTHYLCISSEDKPGENFDHDVNTPVKYIKDLKWYINLV